MNTPYVDYDPCTANSKNTGVRCRRRPIPGGTVCNKHGGGSKVARAAGERVLLTRKLEAKAMAVLAREGIAPLENPLDELGMLAAEAKALTKALGQRVNALKDIESFDAKQSPQIRVEMAAYERAMDRTHKMLDSLIGHGYTERQVKVAETEALLVAGVMRRVIQGLGLTSEQLVLANELMATEFRALDEGMSLL